MRPFANLALLAVLAAACQGTSQTPGQTPAQPTDVASTTPAPTAARTFELDAALVESHEAACQAENEKVLYGDPGDANSTPYKTLIDDLPRIAVGQPSGIPVHVWGDDERYVFCFPLGARVRLSDGEFGPRGQGLVVPVAGLSYTSGPDVAHVWLGTADPGVAWIAAYVPDIGVIEAPVVDGWFVVAWNNDGGIDSDTVEHWIAYDHCGAQLLEVDFAGRVSPCPPE